MKVPLSWLRDFVEINLPVEELGARLTMQGLEVEEIRYVGLPLPDSHSRAGNAHVDTAITGLGWDADKIVVGEIREVMPHPNADRLVLARLHDGDREHTVLTGAPNLFEFKGAGPLENPLKVAYAREGARIYDGHKPGLELTTLKRTTIRGTESYSMVCSEKELGISEEHEGVILLDADAPTGTPLAEYMGDAVFDIAITPNIARNANILGVAREISAMLGVPLKAPSTEVRWSGPPISGRVELEIREPELNPRFVLGLIEDVEVRPSPYWVQRRLRLAGMRPINNIVDSTNYIMIEVGEPLHAFDYDVLVERAGGVPPRIITRPAEAGERLTTLDEVDRALDDFTVLVTDTAGALSIGGVMGGAESEVSEATSNVLLEGAAWNLINIRRTLSSQRLSSEAAYRFSRGVHPAVAELGVRRGLEMMRQLSGGQVAEGLVDEYPLPPSRPTVSITPADVRRWLGIELAPDEVAGLLERLEFTTEVKNGSVQTSPPEHRLDIGEGVTGMADVMEEIARIYGYEKIPEALIADELPPQYGSPSAELEERVRDRLVELGFQEVVTYRLTSPEEEARHLSPGTPSDDRPYIHLENPISQDRRVLRHSLLASVLEVLRKNAQIRSRMAVFEIGPVYLASEEGPLPEERQRLVLALSGPRDLPAWQNAAAERMDFYDLKGAVSELLKGLKVSRAAFQPAKHPSFHPGKCAAVHLEERRLGVLGEVHPLVRESYDLPEGPVLAASFDLVTLLEAIPAVVEIDAVPAYPPVLEDLAFIVDEEIPADVVHAEIVSAGGPLVVDVRLFDLYRGDQIGANMKSLAYSIVYQAPDRTLSDEEVAGVRSRIVKQLGQKLKARIRQ